MFKLTRAGYYADFIVMPAFALALLGWWLGARFVACIGGGVVAWSLVEYLVHRFVFHRVPFLRHEHDSHHADPAAFIGVSSFYTAAFLVILWLIARSALGINDGDAVMIGFVGDYVAYIMVHDRLHHGRLKPGDFLYPAFHRHALHHRGTDMNFGVTTPLWDFVFRTYRR